jgi:hypothetical protein
MKQSILFSVALECMLAHLDREADQFIRQSQPKAQGYQEYLNNLYQPCVSVHVRSI